MSGSFSAILQQIHCHSVDQSRSCRRKEDIQSISTIKNFFEVDCAYMCTSSNNCFVSSIYIWLHRRFKKQLMAIPLNTVNQNCVLMNASPGPSYQQQKHSVWCVHRGQRPPQWGTEGCEDGRQIDYSGLTDTIGFMLVVNTS